MQRTRGPGFIQRSVRPRLDDVELLVFRRIEANSGEKNRTRVAAAGHEVVPLRPARQGGGRQVERSRPANLSGSRAGGSFGLIVPGLMDPTSMVLRFRLGSASG